MDADLQIPTDPIIHGLFKLTRPLINKKLGFTEQGLTLR